MAQYGGDKQFGYEVRHTDEYGNPILKTDEFGNPVPSATGEQFGHELRHTGEQFGNLVHSTTGGTMGEYGSTGHHQQLGHQGLGTNIGQATGDIETDYTSGGRSTGQTGYHGLGTEPAETGGTTGSYQNQPTAATIGGAGIHDTKTGIGTGTGTGVLQRSGSGSSSSSEDDGQGGRRKKKGVLQRIKEKIPGVHSTEEHHQTPTTTTAGGVGHGDQTHEKKGMMEKIKEKLPGHH
ncbi:hypothetical protein E3N88_29954 [Mikania micrantha]|uniref:Dehydrin n=1 Tax=Mikania micrantha TaxID=192012 RepID=A0A5N6MK70_9ASTR|nr:hypothetical protein E3N88_29954 [Mikania micrantha]